MSSFALSCYVCCECSIPTKSLTFQHDTIEENDATTGKRQIITWDDIPKSAAQIFIKLVSF